LKVRKFTALKLFFASVAAAILLCCISLAVFIEILRFVDATEDHSRHELLLLFADAIEKAIESVPNSEINTRVSFEKLKEDFQMRKREKFERSPGDEQANSLAALFRLRLGPHSEFWLIDDRGTVIYSNRGTRIEDPWSEINKPESIHEMTTRQDFFHLQSSNVAIKLNRSPNLYLYAQTNRRPFVGTLLEMQASFIFGTALVTLFLAFAVTFYYLRKKSQQAREIFAGIANGDLKSRFSIKRFDEFGGLMLDFNRMADEIERLVNRVHSTEKTRKKLLQELGHDLRTPLTSLSMSIENIKIYGQKMTGDQRQETWDMIGAEIRYFTELLESWMTLASLDEPKYNLQTQVVNVYELLQNEVSLRRSSQPQFSWKIEHHGAEKRFLVDGDLHLLTRLFKNGLDNAGHFAKQTILIQFKSVEHGNNAKVVIEIIDDGPGLDDETLRCFAQRREQRTLRQGESLHFSMGLGSMIMKSIAEAHGGQIEIQNLQNAGQIVGAQLRITLPLSSISSEH
jgi:signal transduction histidine kinase